MDDVELDLTNVGEGRWKTRALNRAEGVSVVRGAKVKLKRDLALRKKNRNY
jgi:hypothetical protein